MGKRFYSVDSNSHPTDADKLVEDVLNKPLEEPHLTDLKQGLPITPAVERVVEEITKLSFLEIAALSM